MPTSIRQCRAKMRVNNDSDLTAGKRQKIAENKTSPYVCFVSTSRQLVHLATAIVVCSNTKHKKAHVKGIKAPAGRASCSLAAKRRPSLHCLGAIDQPPILLWRSYRLVMQEDARHSLHFPPNYQHMTANLHLQLVTNSHSITLGNFCSYQRTSDAAALFNAYNRVQIPSHQHFSAHNRVRIPTIAPLVPVTCCGTNYGSWQALERIFLCCDNRGWSIARLASGPCANES